MPEKEKRIVETLAQVVKRSNEQTKDYLLGWVEGAAFVVCGQQPFAPADTQNSA